MEPTVRIPRIESAIGPTPLRRFPERRLVSRPELEPAGTEFLEAETGGRNLPERRYLSAEAGNEENRRQESPQKGPFLVESGFRRFGKTGWWCGQSGANLSPPSIP